MFSKFFNISISFLILSLAYGFNHTDICFQDQGETYCKRDRNSQVVCRDLKCFGEYNYECGSEHCAKSEISCDHYRNLNSNLIRLMTSPILYRSLMKKKNLEMLSQIRTCPRFSSILTNTCIKSKKDCFVNNRILYLQNELIRYDENYNCGCKKEYGYRCSRMLCTKNKRSCNEIIKMISKNSSQIFRELNECV